MDLGPKMSKQWICKEWVLVNQTTSKVYFDDKRMKVDKFKLKKIIIGTVWGDQFLYIDFQIWLQVQLLIATVFFPQPLDPLSSRVSYIIYLPLNDLGSPLVNRLSHYLNAYPIGRPYKPSVSWGNQGSIVQGFSPHKCCQRISCRAFNAAIAAFLRYSLASICLVR